MHQESSLRKWRNPVWDIKDPLKQRWAEIVQQMDTHINGVCPLHIFWNRRPLESEQPFAIEYRVNNFHPVTKQSFDRAISGIQEVCAEANIEVKIPDVIKNYELTIKDRDAFIFCIMDLVRVRENDANAVAVVIPLVEMIDEQTVSISGVNPIIVASKDIEKIAKNYIKFIGGQVKIKDKDYNYFYIIDNGQYSLEYPMLVGDKVELQMFPIVLIDPKVSAYEYISDNVVYEGKYTLRMPYLYGAAAWGDKFYANDTDLNIQETRNTYIKEIRAKEKCQEVGYILDPKTGRHIDSSTGKDCPHCKGRGYVKDDSPLHTIFIDFDRLTSEGKTIPEAIRYVEPPQAALTNAQTRVDTYYERMCEALGLIRQNFTNQSGISKEFDYKQQLSLIYKILNDNIRVLRYIYRASEQFLNLGGEITSDVYLVGEIGKASIEELLAKLKQAKDNQSPPHVIMTLVDQIYQKSLSQDVSDLIIDIAKKYDKLYIYGQDEIVNARAQLGNAIGVREVTIHNTVIDVLKEYLEETAETDHDKIIAYLDEYYNQLVPQATPANAIL